MVFNAFLFILFGIDFASNIFYTDCINMIACLLYTSRYNHFRTGIKQKRQDNCFPQNRTSKNSFVISLGLAMAVPATAARTPVSRAALSCSGVHIPPSAMTGRLHASTFSMVGVISVSYTHLDVYKRQSFNSVVPDTVLLSVFRVTWTPAS